MQPGTGSGGAAGAHAGGTGDDEAPKDPGARITHQSYTEKDYEGIPSDNYRLKLITNYLHWRLIKARAIHASARAEESTY